MSLTKEEYNERWEDFLRDMFIEDLDREIKDREKAIEEAIELKDHFRRQGKFVALPTPPGIYN
jgi:hypothetical protein